MKFTYLIVIFQLFELYFGSTESSVHFQGGADISAFRELSAMVAKLKDSSAAANVRIKHLRTSMSLLAKHGSKGREKSCLAFSDLPRNLSFSESLELIHNLDIELELHNLQSGSDRVDECLALYSAQLVEATGAAQRLASNLVQTESRLSALALELWKKLDEKVTGLRERTLSLTFEIHEKQSAIGIIEERCNKLLEFMETHEIYELDTTQAFVHDEFSELFNLDSRKEPLSYHEIEDFCEDAIKLNLRNLDRDRMDLFILDEELSKVQYNLEEVGYLV